MTSAFAGGSRGSGHGLKKTFPPPGPPRLPRRNGFFDVPPPAPYLGAARPDAYPRRPSAALREGLRPRRPRRLPVPPTRQPLSDPAPPAEHPRPPRAPLSPSPAPPPAGSFAAFVGSRQTSSPPTGAGLPGTSSAVAGGMAASLRPGFEPARAGLELPEIWTPVELCS